MFHLKCTNIKAVQADVSVDVETIVRNFSGVQDAGIIIRPHRVAGLRQGDANLLLKSTFENVTYNYSQKMRGQTSTSVDVLLTYKLLSSHHLYTNIHDCKDMDLSTIFLR